MPKALTKKLVETAIAAGSGGKPYVMKWDSSPRGLGLRIRQGGGASWLFRYRPKGAARDAPVRTMTLGTWPEMSVEAARVLALSHAAKIALGGDPGDELRQQKLRARSAVGTALDDYEISLKRRHIVNCKLVMANLRRGFEPVLSSEIETLGLRAIVGLIDRIATTRHKRKDGTTYVTPGAAAEFRKLAHGFLGWAALQGLTKSNALAGFRTPKQSREEKRLKKERQGRALTDHEIVALWRAGADIGSFGALVVAGLLTGLRRNELAALCWSDIRDGVIVIPEGRTKMGKEHRVPVSSAMQSLLAAQSRSAKSGLVFPSPVNGSIMSGWSKLTPKLVMRSGVGFRLHDLRRTTRTLMSRLGVAEAAAEAAIGHTRGGLIATYDKHDQWDERIVAFEKVSDHILALVANNCDAKTAANGIPLPHR